MIDKEVSLLPYNTFQVDEKVAYWSVVKQMNDIHSLLSYSEKPNRPIMILGGGSNILLTQYQDAWIWKNEILGKKIVYEDPNELVIRFGAGEIWDDCVQYCISNNWGGIENLSLIPGCMGAAPIQNIGAYGVELKEVFHSLTAVSLLDGKIHVFNAADCEFGYRDSVFKREAKGKFVITHVELKLQKKLTPNLSYKGITESLQLDGKHMPGIQEVSEAVIALRKSKLPDPKLIGNSGSFFKNPILSRSSWEALKDRYPSIPCYPIQNMQVKTSAAWLIEQCGWRGIRRENHGVYANHALILVNFKGAKGKEIWGLGAGNSGFGESQIWNCTRARSKYLVNKNPIF